MTIEQLPKSHEYKTLLTSEPYVMMLIEAVKIKSSLRHILQSIDQLEPLKQVEIFKTKDKFGHNALMWAVQNKPLLVPSILNAIKSLSSLEQAEILKATNLSGDNALMLAVKTNPSLVPEIFKAMALLNQRVQTEIFKTKDKFGHNALMWAVQKNPQSVPEIFKAMASLPLLAQTAIFKAENKSGHNALIWALKKYPVIIPSLLESAKLLKPSVQAEIYKKIHKYGNKNLINQLPAYFKLHLYKENILHEIKWKIFGISKQDKYKAAQALIDVLDGKKTPNILNEPSIKRALAQGRLNSLYRAVANDLSRKKKFKTIDAEITPDLSAFDNDLKNFLGSEENTTDQQDFSQESENFVEFVEDEDFIKATYKTTPLYPVLPTHSGQITDTKKPKETYLISRQHDFSVHNDCTYRDLITEPLVNDVLSQMQSTTTRTHDATDLIDFSSPDEQDKHPESIAISVKDLLHSLPSPPKDAFFQPESPKSQSASSVKPRPQASTSFN